MLQPEWPAVVISISQKHDVEALRYSHTILLAIPFSGRQLYLLDNPYEALAWISNDTPAFGHVRRKLAHHIRFSVLLGIEKRFVKFRHPIFGHWGRKVPRHEFFSFLSGTKPRFAKLSDPVVGHGRRKLLRVSIFWVRQERFVKFRESA
jgi:hypothetical protein